MAENPASLVYQGREGTGQATIYGPQRDPFAAFYNRKHEATQNLRYQEAQDKLAKQERDRKMSELLDVDPDKAFMPFEEQKRQMAETHRNQLADYIASNNVDPNDPKFRAMAKNGWDKVNAYATRSKYIEKRLADTLATAKNNPYINMDYYLPQINDIWMDANGNAKPLDQIDPKAFDTVFERDPKGFNMQRYTGDFLSNVKDNVYNWVKKRNTAYGTEVDDVELKTKGLLYTPDEKTASGVKEDANGNPIINVTNEVVNSFLENGNVRRYVEAVAQESGIPARDVVTQVIEQNLLAKGGGFNKNVKPMSKMFPSGYYNDANSIGGIKQRDLPKATGRMRNIASIENAFINPDGTRRTEPSPEAMNAAAYIAQNAKFGDGEILSYQFVPGTTKPGTANVKGRPLSNSPDDRLVFEVKFSDRGTPKLKSINLSEPSGASLNSIFETAKAEGGFKIGYDQLLALNEEYRKTGQQIFNDRKDTSSNNIQRAQAEQNQVKEWQEGKSLDLMKNKVVGGKRITSAIPNKTYGFFPGTDGVKVTFDDGSTLVVKEGDYDTFASIYKGTSDDDAEPANTPKPGKSGVTWK